MKFREHRGSLEDSLKTVVEIEDNKTALVEKVREIFAEFYGSASVQHVTADSVTSEFYCADHRIQWDTYIVTYHGPNGEKDVVGFHDGPLDDMHGI